MLLCSSVFFLSPAYAYQTINSAQKKLIGVATPAGVSQDTLQTSTGKIIKGSLTIVGTIFLGLMIYGGFLWMTARGEEGQISKGKDTIVAAIIGLVVIVSAYAITNLIQERLVGGAQNDTQICAQRVSDCSSSCAQGDSPCFQNCLLNSGCNMP